MSKVLITGGSRGIGAAIVKRFAAAGYDVYFTYNSHAEEAHKIAAESGAHPLKCDVRSSEEVAAAVRATGGVDILVNNAGVAGIVQLQDITDAEWDRVADTNLRGTFYMSRAVAEHMISRKYGKIVNISSMWGVSGASCESHYAASKAGIIALTKSLAKELGPSGITVNCIAPGYIETDMNASLDDMSRNALIEATPLCRAGSPDDVAKAALFLVGEEASFITGAVLPVDGGYAI